MSVLSYTSDTYRYDIIIKQHPLTIALDNRYIVSMVRTANTYFSLTNCTKVLQRY